MPAKKKVVKDPIDSVLSNIEKAMGNKGGDSPFSRFGKIKTEKVPSISFGIPAIDEASRIGGVPRGKIIEVYGPESGGKSLLSLYLIASAQKQGLETVLIDAEGSFDPLWAEQHGVDVENLIWSNNFASGENALEYAYQFCKSGAVGLIVIDSTTSLVPKAELDGTLEDNARVGVQAALLSRGVRKISDACIKWGTCCLFINQIREKIGVVYGSNETTPGGRALRFYSSQRLRVSAIGKMKVKENGQDVVIGQLSRVTFVKNKIAPPWGQGEFKIVFSPESLNPVVMLANKAKEEALVKTYKGIFRIAKGVFETNSIDTGTTSMVELADWLIEKGMVIDLLDALIEDVDNDPNAEAIDEAVLEMKEDHSKIVSPRGNDGPIFEAKKIGDGDVKDIDPEELNETLEE